MTTTLASFDSGHGDMVHDVQLDYYGTRLATASSDRGIKLFNVAGEQVHAPCFHSMLSNSFTIQNFERP